MAVPAIREWTLDELHRLPDDGNKYEVVRGALFVTPPPSVEHEVIIARLTRLLDPYVIAQNLGMVFHARAVVRRRGSEVEPDLYVSHDLRSSGIRHENDWERTPLPSLVVEVQSKTTRRRDLNEKRAYYLEDVGVPEYWIVDRQRRIIRVARPGSEDVELESVLQWHPAGATAPLEIDIPKLFG